MNGGRTIAMFLVIALGFVCFAYANTAPVETANVIAPASNDEGVVKTEGEALAIPETENVPAPAPAPVEEVKVDTKVCFYN